MKQRIFKTTLLVGLIIWGCHFLKIGFEQTDVVLFLINSGFGFFVVFFAVYWLILVYAKKYVNSGR